VSDRCATPARTPSGLVAAVHAPLPEPAPGPGANLNRSLLSRARRLTNALRNHTKAILAALTRSSRFAVPSTASPRVPSQERRAMG